MNLQTKPLSTNQTMISLIMSANIHGLIRDMDDLKNTTLYRNKIKATAKSFLTELERHAKEQLWAQEIEGVNINAAVNQLEDISRLHRNLMEIVLLMGDLHESQQILFWQEMQKTFKRFDIPLQLSPSGELKAVRREIV